MVTEHPEPGEVIWCDDAGVTCRRWNWRHGRRTMVTVDTRAMWLVLEALGPMSAKQMTATGEHLMGLIQALCPGRANRNRANRRVHYISCSLGYGPTLRRNTPLSPVRIWRSLLAPLAYTVDCERPRTALENERRTKSDHCLFSLSVVWRTFIAMPPVGMVQIAQARSSDRGEA
ncbi:hypothetical protein [Mesorhizobium sp. M0601]|uniref:hypothetical protein n=1 Tax=Mesorhizobium sp. M0601 TaxID=2956969 RepID=UPI00333AB4AB